jgi:peptidoglycan hydrolase-like protein with peptidoglycan-binding domain
MRRSVIALFLILSLALSPLTAAAAALTSAQVNAVIAVLSSFGVDSATVAAVRAALEGTSVGTSQQETSASLSCPEITKTLSFGARDATASGQVSTLQTFLGIEPTGYFGLETREAVQAFQAAQGVVATGTPATTGYGVVGAKTRAAIAEICGRVSSVVTATTSPSSPSVSVGPIAFSATSFRGPDGRNLNAYNGDYFRAVIQQLGEEDGLNEEELKKIDEALQAELAKTDYYDQYFAELYATAARGEPEAPLARTLRANLVRFLAPFLPDTAYAFIPWGSPRVFVTLACPCSGTFILYMQPTQPTLVPILTTLPGTVIKLFGNLVLPNPKAALGQYEPVGLCLMPGTPCTKVPNRGGIIMAGSSLSI